MSIIPNDAGSEDIPSEFPLLNKIVAPQDLHQFTLDQMEALADEIRRLIIETVSVNGGHLASPLGVVELTIALWHVFDMEKDLVVWDVGHQAYAHKILSGRRDRFHTLRIQDGISGYPSRSESPFDPFGTGHSSTSISAALGMAVARDFQGGDGHVIAVIGDGAMTGGMAFEALNHAGHLSRDLLVILNDNEMSISRNVGALSQYFSRMITARPYKRAKEDVSSFVKRLLGRRLSHTAHRLEQSVKGFITAGGLFQEMGFNYVGPVDGHDLPLLVEIFNNMKLMHGPILFHCATQKGKGYSRAEEDPSKYHGVKPAQIEHEGEARPPERPAQLVSARTFTEVFAEAMLDAAEADPALVGITAAMPAGTGLNRMQEKYPDRFFDVGICEQHAVTFAAGLVTQGMRPVCAIYSTFLQRGYDQFIHDVCLQNLPVVFAVDRAGLVGEDSPTHNGAFDLSFLRAIPNVMVLAPRDGLDLRAMLLWAIKQPGPVVIRYPRDKAPTIGPGEPRDVTRGEVLRTGSDATFLAVGPCVGMCLDASDILAGEGLSVGVADARMVKPVDSALVRSLARMPLLTVEENVLPGGFGSAVMECFEQAGMLGNIRLRRIGLPDAFIEHASRAQQLGLHRLDPAGLAQAVRSWLGGDA
ncbi:MAG: 1-deoxy-D-xylulose-5-phosphate synthase [Candidatus Hydrogenedentes bacterium]|nr:1-deoxy-D-xylulose-5-phosphate synthase [Candidatus Hydrogenedentota bacterium]